jgi:hypothetical protein
VSAAVLARAAASSGDAMRLPVLRIGALARAALERTGGRARPLDAFPDAPYFDADGEIVWIGARLPAMHPRAVMTSAPVPRGRVLSFGALPDSAAFGVPDAPLAVDAARTGRLLARVAAIEPPRGFGALLFGGTPEFPLDLGASRVRALARAYATDDANRVFDATLALAGFGTGLTPSGDDLAGGALFGRRLAAPDGARWHALGERLVLPVAARTHPISAALFADLARGASFEPLHALAAALARDDEAAAVAAAARLAAIGHSSGWDMLTGFAIGMGSTLS